MPEPQETPPAAGKARVEIINTVQTPLGFFVLVVLVTESLLGIVVGLSEGSDRTMAIIAMIALIFTLVGLVAFMAWLKPEVLKGSRPPPAPSPPSPELGTIAEGSKVLHVSKPSVLCAASKGYEKLGFEQDVGIVEKFAKKAKVLGNLTAPLLREVLTEQEFEIVHLLNFVEPGNGTLVFGPGDQMSSEGFSQLIDLCKAQLVVLASCDSIALAAKVSRWTNIIAATNTMDTSDFEQWAACFYRLLFKGQPLSRAFDVARMTTDAPMVLLMKRDLTFSS
jgi:hypothetical protein